VLAKQQQSEQTAAAAAAAPRRQAFSACSHRRRRVVQHRYCRRRQEQQQLLGATHHQQVPSWQRGQARVQRHPEAAATMVTAVLVRRSRLVQQVQTRRMSGAILRRRANEQPWVNPELTCQRRRFLLVSLERQPGAAAQHVCTACQGALRTVHTQILLHM
jgi:hypothetical protein